MIVYIIIPLHKAPLVYTSLLEAQKSIREFFKNLSYYKRLKFEWRMMVKNHWVMEVFLDKRFIEIIPVYKVKVNQIYKGRV